jgi:uncharacterized protein (TIGR03435 family)
VWLILLIGSVLAMGQPPAPLSFDVASIKPAQEPTPEMIAAGKVHLGMSVKGDRVDIGYVTLGNLLPMAFRLKDHQIAGPDWIKGGQRFNILAKLPEGSNEERVPEMLQSLLAERFLLKFHRETRDLAIYALVVAEDGHKMKEALPDPPAPPSGAADAGAAANQIQFTPRPDGVTVKSGAVTTSISMGAGGQMHMQMSKISMAQLAQLLSRYVEKPVMDMTELKGDFQVELDLSMENIMAVARSAGMNLPLPVGSAPAIASDPSGGGSIFSSVQKLGLRLDSRIVPTECVVIDYLEKMPTEN